MNILKAVNLRKIYGQGETEVKALDGVNLEVEKGEFVAIVGTSGSGKSTMLHMIGGLDNPTSGQVIVDGQNLSHMTDEEDGYVFCIEDGKIQAVEVRIFS